jgi:hypothetical protein
MRQQPIPSWREPTLAAIALVLLSGLTGCSAPAQLTNVWAEPGYSGRPPANVLVTALRKDPIQRRRWEDAFVHALARRGVKGTSSYALWPDAPPDTQQVAAAVKENHFDGVLSLVRLEDRSVTTTTPGQIHREAETYFDAWGHAWTRYRDVQAPDLTTTAKVLSFQSDLWRTTDEGGRLIWSGTVQVYESASPNVLEDAVEKGIMPGLTNSGILPKPEGK